MRDDDRLDDQYPASRPAGRSDDVPSSGQVTPGSRRFLIDDLRPARLRGRLADLRDRSRTRLAGLNLRPRDLLAQPGRARVAAATGVVCCLGVVAFAQSRQPETDTPAAAGTPAAQTEQVTPRATTDRASRGQDRAAQTPAAAPTATTPPAPDPDTDGKPEHANPPIDPGPVAGLTEEQMDNAKAIVRTGRDMGMPRRALIIAVATAMQESNLYNYASGVLPESQNYPHQAIGWDHDSVGLFQQRPSSGWGPVGKLMQPAFATAQFLNALKQVPGWQNMRLTDAAQAVQVSAFPEAYAQHEWRATQVVDAIVPGWK